MDLAEDRSVYVALLPERAGHAMVSLYVDDLDAWTESAASRGVHPISSETYDNGVRRVVFRDADGNEFALGGMPADDA